MYQLAARHQPIRMRAGNTQQTRRLRNRQNQRQLFLVHQNLRLVSSCTKEWREETDERAKKTVPQAKKVADRRDHLVSARIETPPINPRGGRMAGDQGHPYRVDRECSSWDTSTCRYVGLEPLA